jgi:RNA polymerase sigma-70 factor (ECF subfamily)
MVDHFRRRRQACAIEDVSDILVVEGFEATSIARMDVARLLDTLPRKQADAIRDTRLDGLSIAEAASSAGIGESDVKVSVHRGLKALAARVRGQA